jgi:hypothetical protein
MKRFASIVVLAIAVAVTVHAAGTLTGRWQGVTDGGATLVLDLTVKGTALTGTFSRNGQTSKLTDGKVAKNSFTFKASINERTDTFSGQFDDDQIKMWLERQGPSKAVVLKRVENK